MNVTFGGTGQDKLFIIAIMCLYYIEQNFTKPETTKSERTMYITNTYFDITFDIFSRGKYRRHPRE